MPPHRLLPAALALAVWLILPSLASPGAAQATVVAGEPPVTWVVPYPVTAPAVSFKDELIVVDRLAPAEDPHLRSYNRTGAVLWSQAMTESPVSDVAASGARWVDDAGVLHDERLVVVRAGTHVRAHRQSDGVTAWIHEVGEADASLFGSPPLDAGGRVFVWLQAGSELRVRAIDRASGVPVWDSTQSWGLGTVQPELVAGGWGVYVTSARSDGRMWQLDHVGGQVRQSWHLDGYRSSVPFVIGDSRPDVHVSLVDAGDATQPTQWRVQERSAETGAVVWQATLTEPGSVACCDHVAPPSVYGSRVVVALQTSFVRLAADDGRFLAETPADGPVWSDVVPGHGVVVRGPAGGLPARLDQIDPETGQRGYAMPLDLKAMPSGGAFVGFFSGNLMAVQALPARLLDAVPSGAIAVHGWFPVTPPTWDLSPQQPGLMYEHDTRTLLVPPVRSLNPMSVLVELEATDGAWDRVGSVSDPDVGGAGDRRWRIDRPEAGRYRVLPMDRVGQLGPPSNVVEVGAAHTSWPGSDPTGTGGGDGGQGGPSSEPVTTTAHPVPASYTTPTTGPPIEGGLIIDSPASGAVLAGDVVVRGHVAARNQTPPHSFPVHATLSWGDQSWTFGKALAGEDGSWSIAWSTTQPYDLTHLLRDGGYRLRVEGSGLAGEARYTLANDQWLRTAAANVTFEGPQEGPLWVNVTWTGSAGFAPAAGFVLVTGGRGDVREPVELRTLTPGEDGKARFTWGTSLRVQPVEHRHLDVSFQAARADGAVVEEAVARRPAPNTSVRYPANDGNEWAAPAAAGLAATGLLAAAVALTEVGRFGALRLMPVALFSRLRGDQVLEHRRREHLVQLVQGRPGIALKELARLSGVQGGALAHHMVTLEREGLVVRQRVGLRVTFHAGAAATVARQVPALQARLLALARAGPITQSEAARRLGVGRQALHYHVNQLRRAGLLELERAGRSADLHVPPSADGRLWTCLACHSLLEGSRVNGTRCQGCGAPQAPSSRRAAS